MSLFSRSSCSRSTAALFLPFVLGLLALATQPTASRAQAASDIPDVSLPASTYYIVTGIDPRMCPSPVCGGVFVKPVNKRRARCGDGSFGKQCYAPILDWSGLGLSQAEIWEIEDAFRNSRALVRGVLDTVDTPYGPLPRLVASDAWLGVTGSAPSGVFLGLAPSGIVCITHPCPVLVALHLNRRGRLFVHELDLTPSGATPAQIELGMTELYQGAGLLVAGKLEKIEGPAGEGQEVVAQEFYTRFATRSGGSCGGGDPLPPPPEVCPTVWDPVCGCDGITYGNDCERLRAGVELAHAGACGG
jgi:Kazal-type serine protease inhibitor domain